MLSWDARKVLSNLKKHGGPLSQPFATGRSLDVLRGIQPCNTVAQPHLVGFEVGRGSWRTTGENGVDQSLFVCFYVFMRTTVELPPELMKRAKARAATRGESLKTLLTRAVASELGRSMHSGESSPRVRLPVFGNPERKPVNVSVRDIELALSDDDVKLAFRSRGRSRRK